MNRGCLKPVKVAGFTLLELLIGLTLLGVLLILIYSALNIGLRAWDTGDQRASDASHQRIVQGFMRRELGQVFPIRWRGIPESRIAFEGTKGELRFVTALNLGSAVREGGLQWGHLYLADDTEEAPDGKRRQSLFLKREGFDLQARDWSGLDGAKPTRLLAGVRDIEFSYFGAENDTAEPKWEDKWDHPMRMPLLIKISLKTDQGRDIPDLVVAPRLGEEAGCYENAFQRQCPARRA